MKYLQTKIILFRFQKNYHNYYNIYTELFNKHIGKDIIQNIELQMYKGKGRPDFHEKEYFNIII